MFPSNTPWSKVLGENPNNSLKNRACGDDNVPFELSILRSSTFEEQFIGLPKLAAAVFLNRISEGYGNYQIAQPVPGLSRGSRLSRVICLDCEIDFNSPRYAGKRAIFPYSNCRCQDYP